MAEDSLHFPFHLMFAPSCIAYLIERVASLVKVKRTRIEERNEANNLWLESGVFLMFIYPVVMDWLNWLWAGAIELRCAVATCCDLGVCGEWICVLCVAVTTRHGVTRPFAASLSIHGARVRCSAVSETINMVYSLSAYGIQCDVTSCSPFPFSMQSILFRLGNGARLANGYIFAIAFTRPWASRNP